MDDLALYPCPYCGETIETGIDPSAGAKQVYTQDCPVCCNPSRLTVRFDREGNGSVDAVGE